MGESGNPAKRARQARIRRAFNGMGYPAESATFFCDESGNTGVHWGDPDQPTFVHGGWLVPTGCEGKIAEAIAELRVRHNLRAAELKWQQLGRRPNPESIFRDFYATMTTSGCLPFLWVMDKDYVTSAKIVETFFDPEYNKHFAMGFTGAYEEKKDLAEAVLHSADVRRRFADLMRAADRPSAEDVVAVAGRLADHFRAGNAPGLAATLRDFSEEAISSICDELGAETWMRTTLSHSLPGLTQLLERFMRECPIEMEIVHDNLVRHGPAFDQVRQMFRASNGRDFITIAGAPFYGSMPTATGLRMADSKAEPMIQMADLLCGFVRNVFTKLKTDVPLSPDDKFVCLRLAEARDDLFTWDANVPAQIWQKFSRIVSATTA